MSYWHSRFVEGCTGLSTCSCTGYCDGSGVSCVDTSDSTLGTICTGVPGTTSRCICTTGPLPENADCEEFHGNGYSGEYTSCWCCTGQTSALRQALSWNGVSLPALLCYPYLPLSFSAACVSTAVVSAPCADGLICDQAHVGFAGQCLPPDVKVYTESCSQKGMPHNSSVVNSCVL